MTKLRNSLILAALLLMAAVFGVSAVARRRSHGADEGKRPLSKSRFWVPRRSIPERLPRSGLYTYNGSSVSARGIGRILK
jgi:hypothetical protein